MKHELNSASIYIATGGLDFDAAKPVLVFIHGSGQSHLTWVLQTRYFAHRGFAVLAPDLPGHGLSGGAPLTSIGDMADWIDGLLASLGVEGLQLELNSLGTTEDRQAYRNALVAWLEQRSEVLDPDSQARLRTNPLRILDSKNNDTQELLKDAPTLAEALSAVSRERFAEVQRGLTALGIPFQLNPRLVRGLDYYSHTAFEITSDQLGAQATVCGGGRYDGLVERLGGRATPAVGFAIGVDRVVDLMSYKDTDLVVGLSVISNSKSDISKISSILRRTDNKFTLIQMNAGKSLTKQIKTAVKSNCDILVIVGSEEMSNNILTIKDLRSDGDDVSISFDDFSKFIEDIK